MSCWTKQKGFPVLDVSIKSSSENSVTLNVTQSKYVTKKSTGIKSFV